MLEIAPTTYWSAKVRPACARTLRDRDMGPKIEALWKKNYSVYGRRKLAKAARKAGLDIGRDQVARLMRAHGIRGASRARKRFTTHADPTAVRAPDLVKRDFTASGPDRLWVADFTYCSTWSGVVYVAFIVDVYSRRIVGWKAARSMHAALVIDALNMAAWTRRGTALDGLICHTDAGSQGGINWSSQHLDHGGVCWDRRTSRRRCVRIEGRSRRRAGRRLRGGRTVSGSGLRSLGATRPRTLRLQRTCHPRSRSGGSVTLVV